VTYCVTCGDSNARFLNEATNARFLDDPNHTQSLREKLVGFDASGMTQVQGSLYQMCLELRGTLYQMCLELEGVEEELHLFRALPVLCEACNGNAERRWRSKAKMTQWLSSRSIEREEKRQLQATDVSDATPLSFNSSSSPDRRNGAKQSMLQADCSADEQSMLQCSAADACHATLSSQTASLSPTFWSSREGKCAGQVHHGQIDHVSHTGKLDATKKDSVTAKEAACLPRAGWQVFGERAEELRPAPAIFGQPSLS